MELFKLLGTIAINNADAINSIDETTNKAKNGSSGIVSAFKKIGTAIATYFAVDKIVSFGQGCIQAAADANAAASQFSQVFGDLEGSAKSSLSGIADETGIVENRMRGSYTQIAAFAKTSGMDTEAALNLSNRAMLAVADSAAFYDRSLEETTESLQSFLKGNYENDAALGLSATETTRNAAANKLYGKSFNDLSESQKQMTLLQMVEDANKLSGAMGQAARESDTWTNQTGNLKQAWEDFKAAIGENFLNVAIDAVKSLSEKVVELTEKVPVAVQWFKDLGTWCNEHQGVLITIGAAIATVTTAVTAYNIVGAITAAVNAAEAGSLAGLIAMKLASAAATMAALAPYLLITAAIAAVIAIGVLLYKNWDTIKQKCVELGQNIKQKFTEMKEAVVNKVTELKDKAKQKFEEVKESIVNICKNVVDWVKDNWKSILTFFINPFAGLFSYFYNNSSKFREFVDNAINAIKQLPSKAWTWLKNTISKVASFVSDLANKGKQAGSKLLTNVVNGIKSLPSKIKSIGKDIITGLWNGISDKFGWLTSKIKSFAKNVTDKLKGFFGIKSPSRVMRDEVGKYLAEGVAVGITENTEVAESAAQKLGAKVLEAAQKRLDNYSTYNEMTLADEVAFWDSVRLEIEEGTDARLDADKKYLDAKKALNDELLNAESEFQTKLGEIYQKIEDKTSSLLQSFDLSKAFESPGTMTQPEMFETMRSQIDALEEYEGIMATLRQDIGGTALFAELEAGGLGAMAQAKALSEMSVNTVKYYASMYDKRNSLANRIANASLEEETINSQQLAYWTLANNYAKSGAMITSGLQSTIDGFKSQGDEGAILLGMQKALAGFASELGAKFADALEGMGLNINNREFARLVKAVN